MNFHGNELSSKTGVFFVLLSAVVASNSSNMGPSNHAFRYVELMLRK
jgi:hypothetical protein